MASALSPMPRLTRVLESRRSPDGAAVRRRRECPGCGHRFTTFERREPEPAYVIKRDGERQRFDRAKLRAALLGAAHKRPVTHRTSRRSSIGSSWPPRTETGELSSERIGELCLAELRELDWGAYLQFAGTLPSMSARPARNEAMVEVGSVRAAREDAESTPEMPFRGGT